MENERSELNEQSEYDIFETLENKSISLLGNGFVKILDCFPRICPKNRTMEFRIVQSARTSYGDSGLKSVKEDQRLLNYLIRNQHTSPLESVSFQFTLKIPIHVKNQLVRHRTSKINECSQRYTQISPEIYRGVPRMQGNTHNKQSSDTTPVPEDIQKLWDSYADHAQKTFEYYNQLIELGVSRETARSHLPLSVYTVLYFQMDLNNLMKFLYLRLKSGAQEEIREVAKAIKELITPLVPDAMAAFDNNFNGTFLTEHDLEVCDITLNGTEYHGSPSEFRELKEKLF